MERDSLASIELLNGCWPALVMVVEEISVEDIFRFDSLVVS